MTFEQKYPELVEMSRIPDLTDTEKQMIENVKILHGRYPFFPKQKPVECLNLIMKREWAEKIVSGEKKIEWRDYSQHYHQRLIDDKTQEFLNQHPDDDLLHIVEPTAVRPVKRIHFHNYNNTWTLDVKCKGNDLVTVNKIGLKIMQDVYHTHDVDEDYEIARKNGGKFYPTYFFFVLGEILDRKNI